MSDIAPAPLDFDATELADLLQRPAVADASKRLVAFISEVRQRFKEILTDARGDMHDLMACLMRNPSRTMEMLQALPKEQGNAIVLLAAASAANDEDTAILGSFFAAFLSNSPAPASAPLDTEWTKQSKRRAWSRCSGRFRAVVRPLQNGRWVYVLYFRGQSRRAGGGGEYAFDDEARAAADSVLANLRAQYGGAGDPRPALIHVPDFHKPLDS